MVLVDVYAVACDATWRCETTFCHKGEEQQGRGGAGGAERSTRFARQGRVGHLGVVYAENPYQSQDDLPFSMAYFTGGSNIEALGL